MGKASFDIETGPDGQLYPMMNEQPELRWAFIRKVYAIIACQLALTCVIGTVIVFSPGITSYMFGTLSGAILRLIFPLITLLLMIPLYFFHKSHPWNFLFLGLFTASVAFSVGLSCSLRSGNVILEAVLLTTVAVVSLTAYTFWAVKRGMDFSFLGPFLFGALLILLVFSIIQIFFPLGKPAVMAISCVAAIIFCGFLVYDTDDLIKRFDYDDYIWAAVTLYLDIINLFLALLSILGILDD